MKQKQFAAWMAAVVLLAGCGSGSTEAGGMMMDSAPEAVQTEIDSAWEMEDWDESFAAQEEDSGGTSRTGYAYQNAGVKLIFRAELSIQTEQFDQSLEALKQLTTQCSGYIEQASLYGGSRRDATANRWGEYTVRVPAEQYSQFLGRAGELGYITSSIESSEDVGAPYYDTEVRLRTQRAKQERLLALLEQAESMEDIIVLENALSETEYQIEQDSSTLNRYDALIGYSTFSICLSEVSRVTQEVGETASLGARMAAGVQSSFRGLVRSGQELLVWVSYHLILVLVLGAAAVAAVAVGRRTLKKLRPRGARKRNQNNL